MNAHDHITDWSGTLRYTISNGFDKEFILHNVQTQDVRTFHDIILLKKYMSLVSPEITKWWWE